MSTILERITDEQKSVVEVILSCAEGDCGNAPVVIVNALAGTGKTSTAEATSMVLNYSGHKMLCVVFNKAAAEEGARRMDGFADVRTTHSLAYSWCGRQYNTEVDGNQKLRGGLRVFDVTKNMGDILRAAAKRLDDINEYKLGYQAIEVVKNFIASPALYDDYFGGLDSKNIPELKLPKSSDTFEEKRAIANNNAQKIILWVAKNIWDAMVDLKSPIPMTHDGYMKLFQLGNFMEKAIRLGGYRVVVVDEAQDSNPSFLHSVLSAKTDVVTVLIGDPRQGIYSYRGAMNALDPEYIKKYRPKESIHERYLTGSFRFGPNVAVHANAMLDIIGVDKAHQVRGIRPADAPQVNTRAILCRTNAGIIAEAVGLKRKGVAYHLFNGVKNYNMQTIMDVYNMSIGSKSHAIQDPFLKNFQYFRDLVFYAENANDHEINVILKMIDDYGNEIPVIIDDILHSDINQNNPESIIITTAHRSKGAEFGQVRLSSDFPLPFVLHDDLPQGYVIRNKADIDEAVKSIPTHERNEKNPLFTMLKKMKLDAESDENNLLFVALSRGIHGVHYGFSKQLLEVSYLKTHKEHTGELGFG